MQHTPIIHLVLTVFLVRSLAAGEFMYVQRALAKHISIAPTHTLSPTHSHPLSHAPSPSPAASEEGSFNGTLDPSQAQALLSLGVILGQDPCGSASGRTLVCDRGSPYRHILSLRLDYCSERALLPSSAWLHLSSLKALAFEECPAQLFEVPPPLAQSLESLTCVASLGTSIFDVVAPGLPDHWLESFYNLLELSISDVQVSASSLHSIISNMKQLQHISLTNTNLRGALPATWPSPSISLLHLSNNELNGIIPASLAEQIPHLESLDLSSNNFKGELPKELGTLQNLEFLSLASNQLNGSIPILIQNLTSLVYIDLSFNMFTGSIPTFFTSMPNLRYIDLRGNSLEGVVPFTQSFLKGLNSCKLGGNPDLCYNKSALGSATMCVQGVWPCEASTEFGLSPSPSPFSIQLEPFKDLSVQHGPNKAVILISLAFSCAFGALLMAFLLSRRCTSKHSSKL